MIEFENYKSNLEIDDKYNVKNVKVTNGVVFTGSTDRIFEKKKKVERTCPLLAAAVIGLDNTSIPIPKKSTFLNIWTDQDAQEIFLTTKPTCYFIFGKSGAGAFALGESLSKKLNCIHLCPKTIIADELEQKSPTGKCLDFNMKHNIPCSFDVILKMLKDKVQSATVQHRGYVISDLPLVTCSKDELYFIKAIFGEEGYLIVEELLFDIICNLKKKKPRKPSSPNTSESSQLSIPGEEEEEEEEHEDRTEDQQGEEAVEEEEDAPAVLPKFLLKSCSDVMEHKKGYYATKQGVLLRQLEAICDLGLAPDVIIHITCPDIDIVTIRKHRYINYKTGHNNVKPFESHYVSELRWPPKYQISDYESPHDAHVFNPKYNCRPPINFKDRCVEQTCNYKKMVTPFMEKKMKDFDPKMILEIDGRANPHILLHIVLERLLLLHIQPVLIPEPLYLEEPPEDMEEFWASVSEFKTIRSGVVNFKRCPSYWYNRCPVELKLRRSITGNPKYAIAFFKHVYLLSSLNNFISFYQNPRPYLKLSYLEPTCRVIIIGTKSSGKSMIAECLSWIFDCPITSFKDFLEQEKEKKYETYARSILSEIIATIEDARYRDWQQIESDRVAKLNAWSQYVLQLLNEYFLLVKSLKQQTEETKPVKEPDENINVEEEQLEEQEEDTVIEESPVLDPKDQMKINALRQKLSFLPILDNLGDCEKAILKKDVSKYAPAELTTLPIKPAIPALGDEDVTIAISNYILTNDLKKELQPTSDEIMSEMVKHILTIDANHEQATNGDELYGKYIIDGLPSDPEYWGHLSNPKLMPDHTIALIENKEVDQDLIQYYINVEKYTKYYEDKILAANDPLIETKLISEKSKLISSIDNIKQLINYCLNRAFDVIFAPKNPADLNGLVTSFSESVDKFREDWDSIKLKLEEKSKSYIEVELENKTDVEIIEEVLLKLRESYTFMPAPFEDDAVEITSDDEDGGNSKDLLTYNDPKFYGETNIYCPVTYYEREILWEGKPEFSLFYNNKVLNFASEEFLEKFRKNKNRYLANNKPFKVFPKVKICVTGSIGCGGTLLSKKIAKELGLLYINFAHIINDYMKPKHFKNVGRNYENMFTDDPLDEEGVVEFQMGEENENLASDILANETEIRRMIQNYFDRGTPILSVLMQKLIKKIWFDPFVPTGFVLDGYPRIPNDVEDMLSAFCIPDIVIDLQCNSEVAVKRLAPIMFNRWKNQLFEAKRVAKTKLNKEREEWTKLITQKVVVKLIIEEIFENMFFSPDDNAKRFSAESAIIDAHPSGSSNVDPHLFNAYKEMIQEYPEPVDTNVWEKFDEARERIETRVEVLFESDDENIQAMKELMIDQKFRMVNIDATKPEDKVFRLSLSKLMNLKNRSRRVPVPDDRFDYLCEFHKPASKVPAFLNVVDIAGLVRGAAEGQGLGNAFLSHIKACDAILNLCRAFDDEDVIHVDGDVNPVRDLETIGEELRLKDEELLMQSFEKLDRVVNRGGDKKLKPEYDALTKIKSILVDEKKHIRFGDWSAADIEVLNKYLFLTSKPALYLVNLSEKDYIRKKNKWLPKLKEWIDKNDPGAPLIPFSGALETKLIEMEAPERQAFLKEHNITSALDKIIIQGYKALNLEYFFTAGPDEVKAWTIQKGTKAPQAAGRIHTDFEKGFIMAEVMHFKDFKEEGTEAACKAAGKYRQQGRNYVVEDGDIIFFKFNAGAGLKDAKKK